MSTKDSFDWHLGAIVDGLAKPHGGRAFLIDLMDWSRNTVIRRLKGESGFTVKELRVVAQALNTTPELLSAQALRNYSGGTEEDGQRKLIEESAAHLVSEPPISLSDQRRKKRPSEMTDDELEAFEGESAANTDTEIGHDEPELP